MKKFGVSRRGGALNPTENIFKIINFRESWTQTNFRKNFRKC